MTDRLKLFLHKVKEDQELANQFMAIRDETDRQTVIEKSIQIARGAGVELSAQDFELPEGEVDDAELQAVTGGSTCGCFLGGGGGDDAKGKACACVVAGFGLNKSDNSLRCACGVVGDGN